MRLDSCRVCGSEMRPIGKCNVCNNYSNLHCKHCGKTVENQTHIHARTF